MNASPRPYPTAEAISAVLDLAERALQADGHIRLGAFFIALKEGTTNNKYGSYVSKYWGDFRGLLSWELLELYEFALLYLEKRHGPLTCRHWESDGSSAESWGYAERSCNHCDRVMEGEPPRWKVGSVRRSAALKAGHPDATAKQLRQVMPDTVWLRKRTAPKAA